MLVRPKRSFPGTALLWTGSALSHVWPHLTLIFVWSVLISLNDAWFREQLTLTMTPFSIMGVAISIFLGFRNNACYDRWWEARKLWGRLINTSRVFCRQTLTLIRADAAAHRALVYRMIAFVHALRLHLREQLGDLSALKPWLDEEELEALQRSSNVPNAILSQTGRVLSIHSHGNRIAGMQLLLLENTLTELANIQGGCERIKNTPVPLAYTILTHRIVGVYCLTLPLGLVDTVGHLAPLVSLLVSFAFLGLDSVGSQIEDPFEEDPNDLPLSAISRMIEVNLREQLGEHGLPPMSQPEKGILS